MKSGGKPYQDPASCASGSEVDCALSQEDLSTIFMNSPIAKAALDSEGKVKFFNHAWAQGGWPAAWTRFENSSRAARNSLRNAFLNALRGKPSPANDSEIKLSDNTIQVARWSLHPWQATDGKPRGAIVYAIDVTEEVKAQQLAGERQAFLEAVLNNIDDAVVACDADGRVRYSNRKLLDYQYEPKAQPKADDEHHLLLDQFMILQEDGKTLQDRDQLPLRQALAGKSVYKLPLVYKINENTTKNVEATAQAILDENGILTGAVTSVYDVTERLQKEKQLRRSEAEARRIAYSDALTGYPNRASLQRTLHHDMSSLCEDGEKVLLLSIDIRRFKAINDIHGEVVGDRLLAEVADRLSDAAGPRAIVGRLAGDEFLIVVPVKAENPLEIAELISTLMDGQHMVDGHRITVQTNIGAAIWPDDGAQGSELLQRADMARQVAKKSALHALKRFTSNMQKDANRQRQIEQDLRKTIQNDGLDVAYQPIVDAQTGQPLGFEALCRWIHPQHGFIAPDQFIAVAEQTGDILDLGEWMIRKVMEDLTNYPGFFVAVNVSPIQFNDAQFVPRLKDALVEFDFDPSRLEIEVTENLVVHDSQQVLTQIRELQALGVRVALDDFGTGYSSLAYLQTYKFDKLKIDRSFVNKLGQDREALALIQCMIQMGKAMNMTVVAEGIETEGQGLMLRHAGCDNFQGYFYAKPMPWQDALDGWINDTTEPADEKPSGAPNSAILAALSKGS